MNKGWILLVIVVVLMAFVSCASAPATLPPEELIIKEIIEVDKSKNELYRLSMEWLAKTFKSSKAVIQYKDKDEGVIIGKGFMVVRYGLGIPADTYFTLTIETKDGKVRATVEEAYMKISVSGTTSESPVDNEFTMNERFKPEVMKLFKSLKDYLEKEYKYRAEFISTFHWCIV